LAELNYFFDRGNDYVFLSREQTLQPPGILERSCAYDFNFSDLELPHESYNGINVRLRYFLIVTIFQSVINMSKEKELWVQTFEEAPEANPTVKMEVGVENSLHIEFEFNHGRYHMNDVVVGKIYFILIRLKVKFMEISLIKVETSGTGSNTYEDKDTVTKFEIMDGCPSRGETIPIRLFLNSTDVCPTMKDINSKFSVRWFLNIVLTDEDDRRYFKKQEFAFFRLRNSKPRNPDHTFK